MSYNHKNYIAKYDQKIMRMNIPLLSRLWMKYKNFDSGTISANINKNPVGDNTRNFAELHAALIGAGYSVTDIDCDYIENYETQQELNIKKKYLIVFDYKNRNKLKNHLITLGEIYDQDFITFNSAKEDKYYIIGTSKNRPENYPGYRNEKVLDKSMFSKSGEFYSSISDLPVIFNENSIINECHSYDDTIYEYNIWHMKILVDLAKKFLNQNFYV